MERPAQAVAEIVEEVVEAVEAVNWQTPHPLGAFKPVSCMLHVCRLPSEQNEPKTGPVRAVLFERDRTCRDDGNKVGRGVARLLESRWSSTSEDKDEIEEGMTPEIEVEERSLSIDRQRVVHTQTCLVRTATSKKPGASLMRITQPRGSSGFGR